MPKAGYSRNAHDGTGFRTRLRARVLHLRAGTASLALVQCDLLGGSAVVQHLVARAVADRTDVPLAGLMHRRHPHPRRTRPVPRHRLLQPLRLQPGRASTPAWTQLLVERIAGGVVEAVETRRPARLAVGTTEVWGLTRNRSLAPHVRNADGRRRPDRAPSGPTCRSTPSCTCSGSTPWPTDGGYEPLAAIVVFSVHGTGIPMRSDEYNADLWAYLVDELGHRIARAPRRRGRSSAPSRAPTPTSPPRCTRARPATSRPGGSGRGIGAAGRRACYERLERRAAPTEVELAAGLREVDLDRSRADRRHHPAPPPGGGRRPGRRRPRERDAGGPPHPAVPGRVAQAAGRRRPAGRQVGHRRAGSSRLVLPLRRVPPGAAGAGAAARRDRAGRPAVRAHRRDRAGASRPPSPPGRRATASSEVVVSSVANEYAGYCATAEEYALQHYEGGHTLYGPQTQPFLAAHAARLAGETVRDRARSSRRAGRAPLRPAPTTATCRRRSGGRPSTRDRARPGHFTDATGHHRPVLGAALARRRPRRPATGTSRSSGSRWTGTARGRVAWQPAMTPTGATSTTRAATSRSSTWAPTDRGHRYAVRWWDPAFRQLPPPPLRARSPTPAAPSWPATPSTEERGSRPGPSLRTHRPVGEAAIRLRVAGVGHGRPCR